MAGGGTAHRVQAPAWDLPLERTAKAPGQARHFLATRLTTLALPTATVDNVLLVASELVTNALLHGAPQIRLSLTPSPEVVRVEVSDGSPALPVARDYGPAATTGRGLGLVAAVSAGWGVTRQVPGKSVWADVARAQEPTPPSVVAPATGSGPPADVGAGSAGTTGSPGAVRVVYRDVPVALYLQLQAHNDALCREAELVTLGAAYPEPGEVGPPAALVELLAALQTVSGQSQQQSRAAVLAASEAGRERVDVTVEVTAGALPAATRHVELLEAADDYARSGVLLISPAPDGVAELRRWFLARLGEQLADASG